MISQTNGKSVAVCKLQKLVLKHPYHQNWTTDTTNLYQNSNDIS